MVRLLRAGSPLLLALAACGDITVKRAFDDAAPPTPDAAPADAAPDAPPDAPATGMVTVTVRDQVGKAATGAQVLFQAADGTVIKDGVTDAAGTVTAVVPAGASVTAVRPPGLGGGGPGTTAQLYTFMGVQPGDKLQVGRAVGPGVQTTFSVQLPRVAGVTSYNVNTACGATSVTVPSGTTAVPPATLNFVDCDGAGVYVEAYDVNFNVVGTILRPSALLTGTLDLRGEVPVPYRSYLVALSDIPAVVTNLQLSFSYVTPTFTGGFGYVGLSGTPSNGSINTRFSGPNIQNVNLFAMLGVQRGGGFEQILRLEPNPSQFAFAVAPAVLPWVAGGLALDTDAHAVRWLELGAGTQTPDIVRVSLYGGGANPVSWTVVGPYQRESLTLPVLKGSLARYAIGPSSQVGAGSVSLLKGPPGAWDALRPSIFDLGNGEVMPLLSNKLGLTSLSLTVAFGGAGFTGRAALPGPRDGLLAAPAVPVTTAR